MQTKWVNDLNGQPFIEMIKIPAGHFTMGSNESSYNSEKPEKEVFLQDYYIAKYPITNKQFYRFIQETGYFNSDENFLQHWITNPDGSKSPSKELLDHPVVYVNWMDCYTFCKTYGLTLPSEAQWEKAARGTDKRTFPWGDEEPDPSIPRCNFRNIFNGTTPVGTFDGSRESYNGVPIQKGTSPYGVEDMAGNVWEWCLDEWDSKWLEHMGENPEDPCNHKKRKQKGLSLDQIRAFSIQQQEVEEQLPFQETERCGAVRGTTSLPPTSAPPIATSSTRRTGTATSALDVASEQQEEEEVKQNPFQDTEYCGAVSVTPSVSPTSAPPIVTSTSHRTGDITSASESASKEEIEEQLPFSKTECCEAVRGATTIPSSSASLIVSTMTRRAGTTTTASESASKEEIEEQLPFQDTESCGAVRGTTTVPPISAPLIATATICRTGATTTASESASKKEEVEENIPFSQIEDCGAVRGTTPIPPTSVLPIATTSTRRSGTTATASESASKEEEVEKQSPFSDMEYCGEVRGTATIPLTFVPPIAAETSRRSRTSSVACVVVSTEETEEQDPFPNFEPCGEVRGTTPLLPTSASPIAVTTTRRTEITTSALDVTSEETEEQNPFRDTECCGEVRGITTLSSTFVPPVAAVTVHRVGESALGCVVAPKQEEEVEEQLPFQEAGCYGDVHLDVLPLTQMPSSRHCDLIMTQKENLILDSESVSEQEEERKQIPFQYSGDYEEVRGEIPGSPSSVPQNATSSTRCTGTTTSACVVASDQQEEEEQCPFQSTEGCMEAPGTTTIPPTSVPPIVSVITRRTETSTMASDVSFEQQDFIKQHVSFSKYKTLRGGSGYDFRPFYIKTTARNYEYPLNHYYDYGFRCSCP